MASLLLSENYLPIKNSQLDLLRIYSLIFCSVLKYFQFLEVKQFLVAYFCGRGLLKAWVLGSA